MIAAFHLSTAGRHPAAIPPGSFVFELDADCPQVID
jgi:hypothetical protein